MKLYRRITKDDHAALLQKGTRVDACVTEIKKMHKGWKVTVVVVRDIFYAGKTYSEILKYEPNCRLGEEVDLYLDEVDADGEFAINV